MIFVRRWDKASHELKSHVVSSKQRKAGASKAVSSSNQNPSLLGRISNIFSSATGQAASEDGARSTEGRSAAKSKRSYGFATSNLAHYDDKHSEDLYRFKNLSSDYMRQPSPTREEDKPAGALTTGSFNVKESDSDDDDDDDARNKGSSKHEEKTKK